MKLIEKQANKAKAEKACAVINKHNKERRDLDKIITQEALDIIKNDDKYKDKNQSSNWYTI